MMMVLSGMSNMEQMEDNISFMKDFHNWNTDYYYSDVHTVNNEKASDCIKWGRCEAVCPQHLNIRELLADVAEEFESPRNRACVPIFEIYVIWSRIIKYPNE